LFTFEWEDTHTGRKTQMAWTRLPQGFKNSSILFGEALGADLLTFPEENPSCTFLQYVNDLLLASHDWEKYWEGTKELFSLTLQSRLKSFLKKGPSLSARGLIPWVHHFRGTTCSRSGEETDHLHHSTAKDQKGGPRIPGSGRILLHLDTRIFKAGQTTL
jgi:hypothetical protein